MLTTFSIAVIILAAGRSSRMGRPKLLLPWGRRSILAHLISQWEKLHAAQIAVLHGSDSEVLAELDRLSFPSGSRIVNPEPERGMFSSIQCAANWSGWKPELTHWTIVLGDQPQVQSATLKALTDFARQNPDAVCQPEWNGRPKHPVVLPRKIFLKLGSSAGPTLKHFLHGENCDLALMKSDDAGLDCDIDYPEDYERARQSYVVEG